MTIKAVVVLASIFYLPMSVESNNVKLYESPDMLNQFKFPASYKVADLQSEELKHRIKIIHQTWDRVSTSNR